MIPQKTTRFIENTQSRIRRLFPRTFQAYCVGAPKTGSTSIVAMFSSSYRSAHEPFPRKTNQLIIDWLDQKIDRSQLQKQLVERDHKLYLELESAHPLGYISDILADTFPRAKFIITLREPYSWLRSRLNYQLKGKGNPPAWKAYRDYFLASRHVNYAEEEKILETLGLCSLDTFLNQYADHYHRVLTQIPEQRFLLIKTSDLNASIPILADFLGIKPNKLEIAHRKKTGQKIEPLKEINPDFTNARIWYHCHDLITQYFPETLPNYQSVKKRSF